jgi:hypothetical protein
MRKFSILLPVIFLVAAVSLPAGATVQQFVGAWESAGGKVKIGVRRIEIKPNGATLTVEAWGGCKKCDYGKTVGIPFAPHPRNRIAEDATVVTARFEHKGKEIILVIRAAGANQVTLEYFEKGKKAGDHEATVQTLSKAR